MGGPAGRTVLRLVDPEISATEFVPVEALYRGRNRGRVGEFDKGESPRPAGIPIRREKNLDKFAHFGKKRFQLAPCGVKVQVSNKDLVSDDDLLSGRSTPASGDVASPWP